MLVQALLDAPLFQTRWRWNTTISLAVPRNRGGRKVPPQLQRMLADDLMASVFPDAAACLADVLTHEHRAVWLAHLSEVNNSHRRAGEAAGVAARAAGRPDVPIQVAARGRVSLHWDLDAPRQLRLF